MKGSPESPMCGFSAKAVKLLEGCLGEEEQSSKSPTSEVESTSGTSCSSGGSASSSSSRTDGVGSYTFVNVLRSEAVREAAKRIGQWPTFPQLYVDGTFVGGVDVMAELYEQKLLLKTLMNTP
eukprot:GHVT01023671.1.p4 GENE.GHVT01023671.1~~GHVT01023671.1.p4  ORF type:complete len:123 (+),score=24.77 GHVT01023671.1:316-684(+)